MFIATRMLATYAGGVYVAEKLITVGMAVQVGMAADHLQHCFREILDMIPDFLKVRPSAPSAPSAASPPPAPPPHSPRRHPHPRRLPATAMR